MKDTTDEFVMTKARKIVRSSACAARKDSAAASVSVLVSVCCRGDFDAVKIQVLLKTFLLFVDSDALESDVTEDCRSLTVSNEAAVSLG